MRLRSSAKWAERQVKCLVLKIRNESNNLQKIRKKSAKWSLNSGQMKKINTERIYMVNVCSEKRRKAEAFDTGDNNNQIKKKPSNININCGN